MGISKDYRDFIADAFSQFADVEVKSMFGGAGIYLDGVMFGLVSSDEAVYLKANDITKLRYEAEGLSPFAPEMRGRPRIAMPYWQVPDRLLEDPGELSEWAREAHEVAVLTQKPKKAKSAKPASKRKPAAAPE